MSKVIIIDDLDPALVYEGSWTTTTAVGTMESRGKSSNEYNSTVHASRTAGDKMTISFEGISITVWGTLDKPATLGPPSASFSIDGGSAVAFNQTGLVTVDLSNEAMPHVALYQTPRLPKGPHTMTITVPKSVPATLYLDFFTVDVGSDSASGNIIVDDSDPLITYNGDWLIGGAQYEYLHTTHGVWSDSQGDATFSFFGDSLSVYGTTGPGILPISYVLDGEQRNSSVTLQGPSWGPHTLIFHAEGLSENQQHKLVISTVTSDKGWYLDYIVYHTKDSQSVTPTGQPSHSKNQSRTGAIVGGVLGAIFLLVLVILGIIFYKRRKPKADYAIIPTRRDNTDTRSIRSVRSTSGLVNDVGMRQASSSTPNGILRSAASSTTAVEQHRVRISESASVSRSSFGNGSSSSQTYGMSSSRPSITQSRNSSPKVQSDGGLPTTGTYGSRVPVTPSTFIKE